MVHSPRVCVLQVEQTVSRLLIRESRPAAKCGHLALNTEKQPFLSFFHVVQWAHAVNDSPCKLFAYVSTCDQWDGEKLVRYHVFVSCRTSGAYTCLHVYPPFTEHQGSGTTNFKLRESAPNVRKCHDSIIYLRVSLLIECNKCTLSPSTHRHIVRAKACLDLNEAWVYLTIWPQPCVQCRRAVVMQSQNTDVV